MVLILTVCSGAVLGLQAASHFDSAVAVVTGAEATARSGPFDDAQSAFTAHDGAELRVLDRHILVELLQGLARWWKSRPATTMAPTAK